MVRLPFSRNNAPNQQPPKVPKEVVDYYQAEQRDRRGVTWLLGFATLILTILLAFGLFYGGRWLYRTVTDDNTNETATTQQTSSQPQPEQPSGASEPSGNSDNKNQNQGNDSESNEPSVDESENGDQPSSSNLKDGEDLPNTGPSSTVAVFVLTSAVAGLGHYALQRRRA